MTRLSYDEIGQALAIVPREGRAAETVEIADGVLLDIDADGRPLAMEVVSLTQLAPFFAAHRGGYVLPERVPIPTNGKHHAYGSRGGQTGRPSSSGASGSSTDCLSRTRNLTAVLP